MTQHLNIVVSGFSCSGSSAVVDWLREFEACHVFPDEFDLLRHPDGILDLREALTSRVTLRRSYMALERFDRLIRVMSRSPQRNFGRGLEALTYEGIEMDLRGFWRQLIAVTYAGGDVATWIQKHAELSPYGNLVEENSFGRGLKSRLVASIEKPKNNTRLKSRIGRVVLRLSGHPIPKILNSMYVSKPLTKSEFDAIARDVLDRITHKIGPSNKSHLVLDQAVSPVDLPEALDLMSNSRVAVVFRDPRDVFMSGLKRDWVPTESAEDFANWMRIAAPRIDVSDPRSILISFEDLMEKPDQSFAKLRKFFCLENQRQTQLGQYFDHSKSKSNVGIWQSHPDQQIIAQVDRLCRENYEDLRRKSVKVA